mgnify:CR=1 FL=1
MTEKSTNPFSLEGQLGLITGGGTGIGFGIAQAYVAQGARVVITGRREELLVEAVAQLGPMADYRVHDVTQYDTTESLIESIEAQSARSRPWSTTPATRSAERRRILRKRKCSRSSTCI